jgi:predicted acetyltransferase
MLALAVIKQKEMGVNKVLVTCAADNIGSIKTIEANGGILENEIVNENGELVKRILDK